MPWVTSGVLPFFRGTYTLQFGHGGDAVGDEMSLELYEAQNGASIRPRR